MEISKHLIIERPERVAYIGVYVDFGEIIFEHRLETTRECITTTGVILVKALNKDFLITAYVPDIKKVDAIYRAEGYSRIPNDIYNKVVKNKDHVILQNLSEEEIKKYWQQKKKQRKKYSW